MAERFHINCELDIGPVELEGPEAHHLAKVCRLRPGETVCLFNGDGREYPAVIETVEKRLVHLRVVGIETPSRELPFRLDVAVTLPKGDRAQLLIEKLTELGVKSFTPLRTARSVVEPSESRIEKLERYVIEASKQCRRNVLMKIEPPSDFDLFIQEPRAGYKLLAHPDGATLGTIKGDATIAIGPEGGFTDKEIAAARTSGWEIVNLGPRILRIETAALALASWIALRHGETPG